jgi:hypothetical protein
MWKFLTLAVIGAFVVLMIFTWIVVIALVIGLIVLVCRLMAADVDPEPASAPFYLRKWTAARKLDVRREHEQWEQDFGARVPQEDAFARLRENLRNLG